MRINCNQNAMIREIKRFVSVVLCFTIGCNSVKEKKHSYWESQKSKFKYSDLKEFVSDSLLTTEINSFHKVRHKSIDSIFSSKKVYLYSWQFSDNEKNAFTLIKDDGELGLGIFYLILDKNDRLISVTDLAGVGREGLYVFETKSKFISKDSILQMRSISQWLDPDKKEKLGNPRGDTTFLRLTIDKNGKVTESILKVVKEINYTNN